MRPDPTWNRWSHKSSAEVHEIRPECLEILPKALRTLYILKILEISYVHPEILEIPVIRPVIPEILKPGVQAPTE